MKILSLLTVALSALILVGCDIPAGDITTEIMVVREKKQNQDFEKSRSALYIIGRYHGGTEQRPALILILPKNFANVGDHIYADGTNIYAGPMEAETK